MSSRECSRRPPVKQVLRQLFGLEDPPEPPKFPKFLQEMRERLRDIDDDDFMIDCVIMALALFDIPGSRVSDSDRQEMMDWAHEVIMEGELTPLTRALATVSPILHKALESRRKRPVRVNPVQSKRAFELAKKFAHLTL